MSLKRRRASEDIEERTRDVSQDISAAVNSRTPHEEVWYADGNIVLATEKHLFRVHKSMLARYSTVFADMFKLDEENASNEETDGQRARGGEGAMDDSWEGVPVVQLVGDSDEDVVVVLRSLYERNFYVVGKFIPVATIFSLLRMGTKYDFRSIRADMVKHLSKYFPRTYEGYKRRAAGKPLPFTDEDLFTLLALARLEDAQIIQPFLFYLCADRSSSKIADLAGPLTKEDRALCLDGREKIQKRAYQMYFAALQYENNGKDFMKNLRDKDLCEDFDCMADFRAQLEKFFRFDDYDLPLFPLGTSKIGVLEGAVVWPVGDIHEKCGKRYIATLASIRRSLWQDLPLIFGLGDWEQVKASSRIDMDDE